MIAALFVAKGGCYYGLPDVDPWDKERDARLYAGPWPVVAHPPCERWGRYWHGGPSVKIRKTKGDDGGCFAAALAAVRRWGGVLEHPEASAAWRAFGLNTPAKWGGWVVADFEGGWTCLRGAGPLRAPSSQGDLALRAWRRAAVAQVGTERQASTLGPRLPLRRGAATSHASAEGHPGGGPRQATRVARVVLARDGQEVVLSRAHGQARERCDAASVPWPVARHGP